MIETWRDSWFEEGLRVFYIVPRARVDFDLPLSISPGLRNWCGRSWDGSSFWLPGCGSNS